MTHKAGFKICSVCKNKFKIEEEAETIRCPACGADDELMHQARKFKNGKFKI